MSNMELVLNMLAEASTTEISKQRDPKTLDENKIIAEEGGSIAGNARQQIESKSGKKIVTSENHTTKQKKIKG